MKMYDGVLQRVRRLEEKNGIRYATCDGKLYLTARVFLIIAFAYGMAINLLYLLGMLITKSGDAKDVYTYILTPVVCSVALIAGFVLLLKKIHIAGGVLSVAASTVLALFFIPLMEGDIANTLQAKYYYRHLAPMSIIFIAAVVMTFIAIRADLKLKKTYNKVVENIYTLYKVNLAEGEDMPEDEWENFLESYEPNNLNNQFLKQNEKLEE